MKKENYSIAAFFLASLFIIVLGSCGLEDYPMIYPIPQSNISPELNDRATVRINNNNLGSPFTHFVIFYRIYVSDVLNTSTTTSTYSSINSVLVSDYNAILPYIDSDTLVNSNMDSIIRVNRKYKYLKLLDTDIDSVLSDSVFNRTLVFDFTSRKFPTMTIDGSSEYILQRSDRNELPDPKPDRYFVNSDDLLDNDYMNENSNADVQDKSNMSDMGRYTYAALFIAAVGTNATTWSFIYSTPSLIHVFLLPDAWE